MTRATLPDRRPNVTRRAEWNGHGFTVTIGLDPATAAPVEVFVDMTKDGPLAAILDDVARAISIALQYGAPPDVLAKAMGKIPVMEWDTETESMVEVLQPASPVGAVIEAIMTEVAE